MKTFYVVRHCAASGQEAEAILTEDGMKQASGLADFLSPFNIDHIISSPFARAIKSIEPLAQRLQLEIHSDVRLIERKLGVLPHADWLQCLEETFNDLSLTFPNGECSNDIITRASSVLDDPSLSGFNNIVIVTHGNFMSLLLRIFDATFGFEQWRSLTNPDVYKLEHNSSSSSLNRIWKSDYSKTKE
jgi:2,3-bisphosphoglycerate-dependent phosphoglycerate mutase